MALDKNVNMVSSIINAFASAIRALVNAVKGSKDLKKEVAPASNKKDAAAAQSETEKS